MSELPDWLSLTPGQAPLIVSMPHTGTDIPVELEARFVSGWLARKDTDFWVHRLYDFAVGLGATTIRTTLSRSVIDMNRDPSGASLYPGQNTTALCPTTTFDGEPLYKVGKTPGDDEIAQRKMQIFAPYHAAVCAEVGRLREAHRRVVLFDAHSIRSRIPRLFDGELPHLNIGTNSGASCAAALTHAIQQVCEGAEFSCVANGRFKGGYTTRHYGKPADGVHAVQLELAMRSYMEEPATPSRDNWPAIYESGRAASVRALLLRILETCVEFASHP